MEGERFRIHFLAKLSDTALIPLGYLLRGFQGLIYINLHLPNCLQACPTL